MTQRVKAFGQTLVFPASMSDEEMAAAIKSNEPAINPNYAPPERGFLDQTVDAVKGAFVPHAYSNPFRRQYESIGQQAEKLSADDENKADPRVQGAPVQRSAVQSAVLDNLFGKAPTDNVGIKSRIQNAAAVDTQAQDMRARSLNVLDSGELRQSDLDNIGSRDAGELVGDLALSTAQGGASLVQGAAWLAGLTGLPTEGIQKSASELNQRLQESKTEKSKLLSKYVMGQEGFINTISAAGANPSLVAEIVAQSAVLMLPGALFASGAASLGKIGLATQAGQRFIANEGMRAAMRVAIKSSAPLTAAAVKTAQLLATKEVVAALATGGAIAGEALVSGGITGADVDLFVRGIDFDHLSENNERFNELTGSGMSKNDARNRLARELSTSSAMMAGTWTGLISYVTGAGRFLGQVATKSGSKSGTEALKNTIRETTEETLQNPGEDYAGYSSKFQVDSREKFDLGQSAALGAVGGFGQAAGLNIINYATLKAEQVNADKLKKSINDINKAQTVDDAISSAFDSTSQKPVTKDDVLRTEDPTLADIERLTGLKPTEAIDQAIIEAQQAIQPLNKVKDEKEITQQAASPTQKAGVLGKQADIVLPDNTTVPAQWDIVDADEISASIKEGVNQPRDRTRVSSDIQIQDIANNLDYRRLSDSPIMDVGAPVLNNEGLIVGGNGRFEAVSLAHSQGTATDYLRALKEDASNKGIDPAIIDAMNKPVLVRRITRPFDTRKLAIASNSGGSLQYSGIELAKIDSDRMKGIENVDIDDSGGIALTVSNIAKLKQSLVDYSPSELASLVDKDGALSQDGIKRVRSAILAKAYGNTATLGRMFESTDSDIRNVLGALTKTAGKVAKAKSHIQFGAAPASIDITNDLLDSVEMLAQIKSKGLSLDMYLAQENLFGDGISDVSKSVLKFLHDNIRSQKKMTAFVSSLYDQILNVDQSTKDIFGDKVTPSKQEIAQNAQQRTEGQSVEQQDIFKPTGKLGEESGKQPSVKKDVTGSDEGGGESPGLRRGEVGVKLSAGEIVLTASGRETTPFPKIDFDSKGKANNTFKRVDLWLIDNAIKEAESRGDKFNLAQFKNVNQKLPSQSDKDSAELYLFTKQPEVLKPILKPLSKSEPKFSRSPEERLKDRDRSRRLEKALNREHTFKITPRDVRLGHTANGRGEEAAAAERLARIFKKRVTWVEADGDFDINGVMLPNIPDTIFIDVRTKKYAHAVIGHELSHHMEQDAPKVYRDMVDALMPLIKDVDAYKEAKELDDMPRKRVIKEIVGDLMGDNFTEQKFWNKVAEHNPSAFKKIADTIISWLKRLVTDAKMRGLGSEQWVTDVVKSQDIIAKAVAQYIDADSSSDGLNNKAKFSKADIERTLIAQHNLSIRNLVHADRMGALAAPSIAITDKAHPVTGFGEITLLADEDFVRNARTFGADIYSTRYPEVSFEFSNNDVKEINDEFKDERARLGDGEFYKSNLDDPFSALKESPSVAVKFLESQGIKPAIQVIKPGNKPGPRLMKWVKSSLDGYDLKNNKSFALDVKEDYIAKFKDIPANEMKGILPKNGDQWQNMVNKRSSEIDRYRDALKNKGKIDLERTRLSLSEQIKLKKKTEQFDKYIDDVIFSINPKQRIFDKHTSVGSGRKYIEHNLGNVVRKMRANFVGGENFGFGLNKIRSPHAPEFKSIAQIRKNKHRLMSSEDFRIIADDIGKEFDTLIEKVQKYGTYSGFDNVGQAIFESAKIGLSKALTSNGFKDVPADVKAEIETFIAKLKDMPTEYFEAKVLRGVGLREFKSAIIPKDAPKEVLDILKKNGITDIRKYKPGDNEDRVRKINEVDHVMFSRADPADRFYSKLKQAIESAPEKLFSTGAQTKLWLQANAGKLGVKKDEVYWSGIENWLDAQTKVSKDDVLAFLDKNGVRVEMKVLGEAKTDTSRDSEQIPKGWLEGYYDSSGNYENEGVTFDGSALAFDGGYEFNLTDEGNNVYEGDGYYWIYEGDELKQFIENPNSATESFDGETKHNNASLVLPGGTDYKELVLVAPQAKEWGESDATHFGDTGKGKTIGWIRINTRKDSQGKIGTFIEELQSKRVQEGRSNAFDHEITNDEIQALKDDKWVMEKSVIDPSKPTADPSNQGYKANRLLSKFASVARTERDAWRNAFISSRGRLVPPMPFVSDTNNKATNAYITLLMKNAVIKAIENDSDFVAWTTAKQQADRYDLSKQIDNIEYLKHDDGNKYYVYAHKDGNEIYGSSSDTIQDIEDLAGEEIAAKIGSNEGALNGNGYRSLSGIDLKVGGKWTKTMYGDANGLDQRLAPSLISQAAKDVFKHIGGGKVESIEVEGTGKQPGFYLTNGMKAKIESDGLPLFSRADKKSNKKSIDVNEKKLSAKNQTTLYHVSTSKDISPSIRNSSDVKTGGAGEFFLTSEPDVWADTLKRDKVTAYQVDDNKIAKQWPSIKELNKWGLDKGYLEMKEVNRPDGSIVLDIGGKVMIRPVETEKGKLLPFYRSQDPLRGGNQQKHLGYAYLKEKGFIGYESEYSRDGHEVAIFDVAGLKKTNPKGEKDVKLSRADVADKPFDGEESAKAPLGKDQKTIMVDGVERPTQNSERKLIHPAEKGIRNFYAWFGDSKVVDGQGRPQVIYHGTNSDVESFSHDFQGTSGQGSGEPAFFFDSSAENASRYVRGVRAGGNVIPVFLSLQNPLVVERNNTKHGYDGEFNKVSFANFIDDAREDGHDGVIFRDVLDRGKRSTQYIALDSLQIKSAIGNAGAFSKDSDDIRFSFAGKKAKTADNMTLEAAQERLSRGGDKEQVRRDTGWFQGVDQKWRFEINDSDASVKKPFPQKGQSWGSVYDSIYPNKINTKGEGVKVGDIIDHPALFAAYPSIAEISVGAQNGLSASFARKSALGPDQIWIGREVVMSDVKSILLHEIQHGIQNMEGFASGGNEGSAAFSDVMPKINEIRRKIKSLNIDPYAIQNKKTMGVKVDQSDLDKYAEWEKLKAVEDGLRNNRMTPSQAYKHLAGEVEARNVQSRMGLSEESRKSTSPESTQDIPNADVIVVFNGTVMESAPQPENAPKSLGLGKPEGESPDSGIPGETWFRKFQREWQDYFNRFTVLKDWLASEGVNLSEKADVHLAEELFHARVANQKEDFRDFTVNPLIQKIAEAGYKMTDIADYLEAQHAKEANEQIRKLHNTDDAGVTAYGVSDEDAEAYLDKAPEELGNLANELRAITDSTLRLREENGLPIMKGPYQFYIPVKGAEDQPKGTGKGFSVTVKPKRRLGHSKRDEAVIENILHDHERAIFEVEKNRVGKHLAMMAAEIAMPELMTVGQPVKRKSLQNNTAYEVQVKGVVSAVFDTKEAAQLFKSSLPLVDKKIASTEVVINPTTDQRVVSSASPMLADNEINVYIQGHAIRIQINDELLAQAYKKLGIDGYGKMVAAGRALNGYLSKVYTGYNPEFIQVNILRDFQTGIINLTGEEGIVMAAKAIKNYSRTFVSLLRYASSNRKKSDKWIDMYRENGGNTGAAYLSDRERLGNDIATEYAAYQGVLANLKEGKPVFAARAAGRKVFNIFLKWIYNLNQAGENAMRLAAFMAMVESGKTLKEAGHVAKNMTVNFNRKGENGATANAAWLFFNAAVQGNAAMSHALFKGKHKGQAWALSTGVMALGYIVASALGGGGEDDYDKIDDYIKERNLVIKHGDGWLKIPVTYGYGFFYNIGRAMADAQRKDELGLMPWHIMASAIEELTPFGDIVVGSDEEFKMDQLFLGALPTAAKIPGQVAANKNTFTGGEIMPDNTFDKSQPEREKMWRGTKGTIYDELAGYLQMVGLDVSPESLKFSVRTATGGTGAVVDSAVSAAALKAGGATLDATETPFLRKIYHENTIRSDRAAFYKARNEARTAAEEFSRTMKRNDFAAAEEFQADNKEMLMLDRYADRLQKFVRMWRDQQDAVRVDKNLSVGDKRLKLKELEGQEAKLYDKYLDVFKTSKKKE